MPLADFPTAPEQRATTTSAPRGGARTFPLLSVPSKPLGAAAPVWASRMASGRLLLAHKGARLRVRKPQGPVFPFEGAVLSVPSLQRSAPAPPRPEQRSSCCHSEPIEMTCSCVLRVMC